MNKSCCEKCWMTHTTHKPPRLLKEPFCIESSCSCHVAKVEDWRITHAEILSKMDYKDPTPTLPWEEEFIRKTTAIARYADAGDDREYGTELARLLPYVRKLLTEKEAEVRAKTLEEAIGVMPKLEHHRESEEIDFDWQNEQLVHIHKCGESDGEYDYHLRAHANLEQLKNKK